MSATGMRLRLGAPGGRKGGLELNNRILTIVCLIFLCACIAASTVSYAAASGGNATSTPEKSKAGREKGSQDVYKQALEEMTPLTIGWTSDARSKALQMDDGIVAPLDLATRAVRATAPSVPG